MTAEEQKRKEKETVRRIREMREKGDDKGRRHPAPPKRRKRTER